MRKWLAVIPGLALTLAACGTPPQRTNFATWQSATSATCPGGIGCVIPVGPDRHPYPEAKSEQSPAACGGSRIEPPELGNQPGYHELTISVERHTGAAPLLSRDDLQMFQGKNELPIKYFQQEPASVGILVDTSGSMDPKLQQAQNAITEFVKDLNPQDDVFLFAFSSTPFVLQPFTTNHRLVVTRLSLLHAYGQTALFDTIVDGLMTVRDGCNKKKALFVITDGIDNSSQATQKEVVAAAQRMKVPIYSIGIGASNNEAGSSLSRLLLGSDLGDEVDARTLQTLSSGTGAKTYLIHEVGDGNALTADAKAIAAAISDHYIIGYVASGANQNDLRLELRNRSDLTLNVEGASLTAVSNAAPPTH